MKNLTPILQQTLLEIHLFQVENKQMPTIRDLARRIDREVVSVQRRIERLRELGYLKEISRKQARSIAFAERIDVVNGKIPVIGVCN